MAKGEYPYENPSIVLTLYLNSYVNPGVVEIVTNVFNYSIVSPTISTNVKP
jgi:hypothetical protein